MYGGDTDELHFLSLLIIISTYKIHDLMVLDVV
jgi:hypothetical protein